MLLIVWELCGRAGLLDQRYFPIPSTIFHALKALAVSGELWSNTEASLQRLAIGFFVGGIPALAIGIAMGLSRPLRLVVDPLIAATYPIPKSAILPLLLLIFGLGEGSKIAMVAIGVFYPVAINTLAGVLAINKVYFEVGTHFKATPWQTFRTIALPGALPFIMTGVKLGAGLGLVLIALAEMVGAKKGLGYMIWNSWELLVVDTMYAGILVIAVIGFALTIVFNEIERVVVPWGTPR
ncbi:ABC transporter permease [Bradyrhizobium sp. CCGUVB14]|uniref:ABC transporter permease n=1 Tax=Bradyrhizobium sp. CCGUVB14 TaxID=2949628 RepID=UPI0020B230EC|nr:ABC transporter permease [Bradyrhizobium sp. CCGUVB14]MCP3446100.1 ABC transporter permease [Bradyrhizobium sp. CCGUVB14]